MKLAKIINRVKFIEDFKKKGLNKLLYNKFFYRNAFRKSIVLESDLELFGSMENKRSTAGLCLSYNLMKFSSNLFDCYKFELVGTHHKSEFLKFHGSNSYFLDNFKTSTLDENFNIIAMNKVLLLTKPIRGGFLSLYLGIVGFLPISHLNFICNQLSLKRSKILQDCFARTSSLRGYLNFLFVNSSYILNIPFLTMVFILKPARFWTRFSKMTIFKPVLDKMMPSKTARICSSITDSDWNNLRRYFGQSFICLFFTYRKDSVKEEQTLCSPDSVKAKSSNPRSSDSVKPKPVVPRSSDSVKAKSSNPRSSDSVRK